MSAFIQYWKYGNVRYNEDKGVGTPLNHTSGDFFKSEGVEPGDKLYIVSYHRGKMLLAGRMIVDRIVTQGQAEKILDEYNLWKKREHIISDHGTVLTSQRKVPDSAVKRLRFGDGEGKQLAFEDEEAGMLAPETLRGRRGLRRLTPESAESLDELLEIPERDAITNYPDEVTEAVKFNEGATRRVAVNAYERNPKARKKCIAHYGAKCCVCDFDFGKQYGSLGKEFIHVHHLKRLADLRKEYQVDPIVDLRPVCPNCHAMLHRRGFLTIEALKKIYLDATRFAKREDDAEEESDDLSIGNTVEFKIKGSKKPGTGKVTKIDAKKKIVTVKGKTGIAKVAFDELICIVE